jgi:RNA polymerase sigma-B factor
MCMGAEAEEGLEQVTEQLVSTREEDHVRFREFVRTRNAALRDELVGAHLGLAHQIARRFANRGEPHEDLVQVASLALVKAVDHFEPEHGVRFSTFAVKCIVGELKRHFRDKGWAIRAPRRIQELYLELGHEIDRLVQEQGRAPTVSELARATKATEHQVLEALEAGRGYRSSSLDVPDQEGQPLVESLGSEDTDLARIEDRSVLEIALEQLSDRDRQVIRYRFVDAMTQSEIASRLGVSQMQISRMLAASLRRLRANFEEDRGGDPGR